MLNDSSRRSSGMFSICSGFPMSGTSHAFGSRISTFVL